MRFPLPKRGRAHDSRAIANYLIDRTGETDDCNTHLHLMKLIYFSHAFMLAQFGQALFRHKVRVWPYGPVIVEVYDELKRHGRNLIRERIHGVPNAEFEHREIGMMNAVLENYGGLTAWELSAMTHWPNSPWDVIRRKRGERAVIPNNLIASYYSRFYQ